MLKRTLIVALFLTAFAASAGSAQAVGPHWFWGKPVEEIAGRARRSRSKRKAALTFTVTPVSGKPLKTKCNDRRPRADRKPARRRSW